jgi:DNA-binding transcriptional ArsR family regulator
MEGELLRAVNKSFGDGTPPFDDTAAGPEQPAGGGSDAAPPGREGSGGSDGSAQVGVGVGVQHLAPHTGGQAAGSAGPGSPAAGSGGLPAPAARHAKREWTARELAEAELPEPDWLLPEALPKSAVAVLAGRPKMGKTRFLLWLSAVLAKAGGKRVLYIAMEGGGAAQWRPRMRELQQVLGEQGLEGLPDTLVLYLPGWLKRYDRGGLEQLRAEVLSGRWDLIVIDPWQRFAPPKKRQGTAYEQDYDIAGPVADLAAQGNCTILAVFHLTKRSGNVGDPLDAINASTGIMAAADVIWVLRGHRGDPRARILVSGRDVPEQVLHLERRPDGFWRCIGWRRWEETEELDRPPAPQQDNSTALAILQALQQHGPLQPKALAIATGLNSSTVRWWLPKLLDRGDLVKLPGRRYDRRPGLFVVDWDSVPDEPPDDWRPDDEEAG